jgi:hypothetical protein
MAKQYKEMQIVQYWNANTYRWVSPSSDEAVQQVMSFNGWYGI